MNLLPNIQNNILNENLRKIQMKKNPGHEEKLKEEEKNAID